VACFSPVVGPLDGAAADPVGACGVRSDSRATTMVIAAASTASPASWPPTRRGSSGRVDAVGVTAVAWRLCCWLPLGLGVELGVTTGNSPDKLAGVTVEPGGKVTPGSVGSGDVGDGEGVDWSTRAVTAASAGERDVLCTAIVKVICSPIVALMPTWALTISSRA
jgi:hypothetical protein